MRRQSGEHIAAAGSTAAMQQKAGPPFQPGDGLFHPLLIVLFHEMCIRDRAKENPAQKLTILSCTNKNLSLIHI